MLQMLFLDASWSYLLTIDNEGNELFIVDDPVSVLVDLLHHHLRLLGTHLLPEVGHHLAQLTAVDEAVTIRIKHFECFPRNNG